MWLMLWLAAARAEPTLEDPRSASPAADPRGVNLRGVDPRGSGWPVLGVPAPVALASEPLPPGLDLNYRTYNTSAWIGAGGATGGVIGAFDKDTGGVVVFSDLVGYGAAFASLQQVRRAGGHPTAVPLLAGVALLIAGGVASATGDANAPFLVAAGGAAPVVQAVVDWVVVTDLEGGKP